VKRREEKLKEQEEALKLKEQKRIEYEEFLVQKAAKEVSDSIGGSFVL
jgi:hypothetical protein